MAESKSRLLYILQYLWLKTDAEHYRFIADVHDAGEMLPWLRTFIVRIEGFSCSNKAVAEKFWQDLAEVYAMYGVKKAGEA